LGAGPSTTSVSTSLLLQQQQLAERLENIHINKLTSSSILSNNPYQQPQQSPLTLPENISASISTPQDGMTTTTSSVGKGMLLQRLPPHIRLFMVEFKSGRTDFYYVSDPLLQLRVGDLVIVEADRGKDLGKVATDILTVDQVILLQQQQNNSNKSINTIIDEEDKKVSSSSSQSSSNSSSDSHVKRIYRQASTDEVNMLIMKDQDEQRALAVCLQKIKNRKLPMEVVDAEFQW
jgi:hypothetical protein